MGLASLCIQILSFQIGNMKKTFYVGLSDKDTHTQLISELEAYKVLMNKVGTHFWWGTIYSGRGFYKHDDGSVVVENTLIVMTSTDKDHTAFVEEVKRDFNQESILVEVETVSQSFE